MTTLTFADEGNPPQVAEVKRKGSGSLLTREPSMAGPGAVSLSDLGPRRLPLESFQWPLDGQALLASSSDEGEGLFSREGNKSQHRWWLGSRTCHPGQGRDVVWSAGP